MRPIRPVMVALLAIACGDPTRPPRPAEIVIAPAQLSLDAIGATATVSAVVRDADGVEIPDAVVTWSAPSTIRLTPVEGTPNRAQVVAIASGSGPITASAGGITRSLDVTVAQRPAAIEVIIPQQHAVVAVPLSLPVRALIRDPLGHPAAHVPVSFTTDDGGTFVPATATTGADGFVETQWTLGPRAGEQRVVARAGSAAGTAMITALAGPAAALHKVAGDGQSGWTGARVDVPPAVRVTDAHGNGVPGIEVVFTTTSGSVTGATRITTMDGSAVVESWTLGDTPGTMTLTATAGAVGTTSFTADAVAGLPMVRIEARDGDWQLATSGTTLEMAPTVRIVDTSGVPQGNRRVTFTVVTGGGSVGQETVVTAADGTAAVQWTLGAEPGPNELTVRIVDGPATNNGLPFRATGCTGGSGAYTINVCFLSAVTATQRAAFVNAAARWASIITADVPDIEVDLPNPQCMRELPPIRSRIDDLVIFAAVEPIDGGGRILGSAGWCYRRVDGLPLIGGMRFDEADLLTIESSGRLPAVIQHEIGHVLGIGTLWSSSGFLQSPSVAGQLSLDTHFNGAHAVSGFDQIGGTAYTAGAKVPVENAGGPGSINAHWRESVLGNELMTPAINTGVNPLTVLSALSLRDIGYEVDPARADSHLMSDVLADRRAAPVFHLIGDVHEGPRHTVDRQGRVRRLP